ncbi:hypothetical protein ZHAS_00018410 [Anopheles sinensis]|uniref:Uncharacterized protein n=1 Tax=Anopheles sinensis TaxID=74873 RepID=A0A084WJJ2_ANOSI|nr:hypothetical protein ZHAS_00018410 [Anopheles sinensis]
MGAGAPGAKTKTRTRKARSTCAHHDSPRRTPCDTNTRLRLSPETGGRETPRVFHEKPATCEQ